MNLRQFEILRELHLGAMAVDLFFIISGYLITKILITSRGQPGYFRKFYVRRAFRILPLYYLVVVSGLIVAWAAGRNYHAWPFYLTFLQNLLNHPTLMEEAILPARYVSVSGLSPLWSLATEEQFYLLIPLLIAVTPPRWLPWILSLIAGLGISLFHIAFVGESSDNWCYPNFRFPWLRMQYLALGGLLNFSMRWWGIIGLLVAWSLLAVASNGPTEWLPIFVLAGSLFTVDAAIQGGWRLNNRFLAQLGVMCFGLYVLHMPILILLRPVFRALSLSFALQGLLFGGGCFLAAWLSFHWFEQPVQRWRARFE